MSSISTKSLQRGSFFDIFKPRYHEAVYRLKNSLIALIALFTLTHLLPLPTPYASAWNLYCDSFQSSWEKSLAITGAISMHQVTLPPLLTQDHDCACACRTIRLQSSPRQHFPSNHRDPLPTNTLLSSLITFQIPLASFKRRPAAATPSHDDTAHVAGQIRWPFSQSASLTSPYTYPQSSIHASICRQRPSANSPSLPLPPRVAVPSTQALVLAVLQTRAVSPSPTNSPLLIIIPLRPTFPSVHPPARAHSRLHLHLRKRLPHLRRTADGGRLPDVRHFSCFLF